MSFYFVPGIYWLLSMCVSSTVLQDTWHPHFIDVKQDMEIKWPEVSPLDRAAI